MYSLDEMLSWLPWRRSLPRTSLNEAKQSLKFLDAKAFSAHLFDVDIEKSLANETKYTLLPAI
jgi:hypothetical protein